MNVLLLGPDPTALADFIRGAGDDIRRAEDPLDAGHELIDWADLVVSFGYRHIIDAATIARIEGRAINVHISLLPWNRGADPNVWSFLEDTPKGVTIHMLDEGVDTGAILLQQRVDLGAPHTLRSSYALLVNTADKLFRENWGRLREGRVTARLQGAGGSTHRSADLERFEHALTDGWDTPVAGLIGLAKRMRDDEVTS